jgi:hypothetical protein
MTDLLQGKSTLNHMETVTMKTSQQGSGWPEREA